MTSLFQKKLSKFILPVFAVLFFFSCQKDISNDGGNTNNGTTPDLTTKVTSSVSGFVTNESNAPVASAAVTVGGIPTTTNEYGYFEIKNAQVVKSAAVVTVTMPGYFKGIKTYIAENNKAAFFRIKLIPKNNAGNINAAVGGNVTLSNGLIVALPANGVVKAADNSAYTGIINVAAHWIDPSASDLNQTMPGDLRGISTDGSLKTLTTYGMAAVELTSASGELLQIATGKKATLTLTIPSAILATAPSTIPLWSFDETKGLWKQEGTATKTGNTYVGEVSHFSFWNCDQPADYVEFNCTVKNDAGDPIANAAVKISEVSNPANARYGYTDATGYVAGAIPDNMQLKLEILTSYDCGTPVYTQTFATANADVSLGTIVINATLGAATVSGTVTDCSNTAVTNGTIVVLRDGWYSIFPISNTGTFSFSTILCNNTAAISLVAVDAVANQQSAPLTQTIVGGANTVGNLQACGLSTQEFIHYTIDGGASIDFTLPADSIIQTGNGTTDICSINGSRIVTPTQTDYVNFSFPSIGIATGSVQGLLSFYSSQIVNQTSISGAVDVHITEYGAVGEFIAGNFTGTVVSPAPVISYNIVCSFRVRRNF